VREYPSDLSADMRVCQLIICKLHLDVPSDGLHDSRLLFWVAVSIRCADRGGPAPVRQDGDSCKHRIVPQGASVKIVEETPYRFRIELEPPMRVPGIVFATSGLLPDARADKSLEQVRNVATLPGIVEASYAMPDVHWGYGFPIGGVAGTDVDAGGVSDLRSSIAPLVDENGGGPVTSAHTGAGEPVGGV
jgi:hypothetical protein